MDDNFLKREFDELFKNRGGVVIAEEDNEFSGIVDFLPRIRNHVSGSIAGKEHLPLPYIDFIDNPGINAVVTKKESTYFVGLHQGTLYVLTEIFLTMLSNSDVLPHIGDTTNESSPKLFNAQVTDLEKLELARDIFGSEVPNLIPKDPERSHLAYALLYTAINFLVKHELAHIFNGHIDLFIQKTGHLTYAETLTNRPSGVSLDSIDAQTLEMDADAYGISQIIDELIDFNDDPAYAMGLGFPSSFTTLKSSLISFYLCHIFTF